GLHAGLADGPRVAAILALVQLVAIAIAARAAIDDKRSALCILEPELSERPDASFAEHGVLAPRLAAVVGLQQERIARQRVECLSADPSRLGAGELNVVEARAAQALKALRPGMTVVVRPEEHAIQGRRRGVNISGGEDANTRRFDGREFQVDRAGIVLRAIESGGADVFRGALE